MPRYGLSTWLLKLFEEVGLKHQYLAAILYALSGRVSDKGFGLPRIDLEGRVQAFFFIQRSRS